MVNPDEQATYIGKILGNLQGLELMLRLFLYEKTGPQDTTLHLENLEKDDWVQENPITNYNSLRVLVKKVNEQLENLGVSDRLDDSLVDLRDTIAHGRVTSLHPQGPCRLLKFSRPMNGQVQVTTAITLSSRWLKEQLKRTASEMRKVQQIGISLGFTSFPQL